ncbi:SDR family oxidoreductase [Kineosporia sp. R_H_3]|uniref:SDR family oxidoreductase n=1 Tax=Kineosporia sp. R_H_3 TaxID=1961848 RepID=UPI000B4B1213|nr:SDR family oxidoreductase [Kineosporia sp. R_H_3]
MTATDHARPVAVVTGAARGIGAATAVGLARAGWDLVLGDVPAPDAVPGLTYPLASAEDLAASAAACRAAGADVVHAPCDVRRPDDVAHLVGLAGDRLVAAVAVAGILGAEGPAWDLTPEDLDRDLSVNLHGVANLARAACPVLLAAAPARGRFVAVVSSAGTRGLPRLASYVAAKHAALGYVRSLAADLAPFGVTANAVMPGSTRTAMLTRTAAAYGLDDVERFAPSQRLGRLLEPAEPAAAVVWLCSEAASAVTGTALEVDGGFVG